jgi:hypothetical protein
LLILEWPRIPIPLITICIVAAALLVWLLTNEYKPRRVPVSLPDVVYICSSSLFLFFASFGPFFLLRDSFLTLRSLFFCIPVFAILIQWAWDKLYRYRVFTPVAGLVIVACLLFGVGSVNSFRVNHQDDRYIANQIIDILYVDSHPASNAERYGKVYLYGARHQYTPHGGVHLHSATLSDWSLSVLVNAYEMERFGNRYILPDGGYYLHPVPYSQPGPAVPDTNDLILVINEQAFVRVHYP